MELKRCNAIADVEAFLKTQDPDLDVVVDSSLQYYYIYTWQLKRDCINIIYEGKAGRFKLLEMF